MRVWSVSLRWHYPVQVLGVGGIEGAALSAWLTKLPLFGFAW